MPTEISSKKALKRKGATIPPKATISPPNSGPGMFAILATEAATPKNCPCSSSLAVFDISDGTVVFIIPNPAARRAFVK